MLGYLGLSRDRTTSPKTAAVTEADTTTTNEKPGPIYLLSRPEPEDIPRNWEFIDYAPAGIDVGCYRAHARGEPRAKITLFSGLKADMETYNTQQIRALQKIGVEIDIILLPDPGPQIGYLKDNKDIVREALIDNPPPDGQKQDIPHFIFGHSLGGRAFVANMLDEEFAEKVEETYSLAVLIAPHFSSPYRSKPVLNALYTSYCKIFADKSYGEAPLDWVFSATEKFKAMLKRDNKNGALREDFQERTRATYSPITTQNTATTHGQILYSNQKGEELWEKIQDQGVPEATIRFPTIMLGGSKDFVSCKNYIRNVADAFGADFHEFDTYHHPFLESRSAQRLILKAMKEITDNWENVTVPNEGKLMHGVKRARSALKRALTANYSRENKKRA